MLTPPSPFYRVLEALAGVMKKKTKLDRKRSWIIPICTLYEIIHKRYQKFYQKTSKMFYTSSKVSRSKINLQTWVIFYTPISNI